MDFGKSDVTPADGPVQPLRGSTFNVSARPPSPPTHAPMRPQPMLTRKIMPVLDAATIAICAIVPT